MNILSIFVSIFIILLIVVIHEYGHFIVARKCNVFVKTFSVGFGKTLFSVKSKKSGTLYKISAIPLGGYIEPVDQEMLNKMKQKCVENGESMEELAAIEGHTMDDATPLQRFLIASAGPIANFLSAIILFVCFYSFVGFNVYHVKEETQVAAQYGLKVDDTLLEYTNLGENKGILVVADKAGNERKINVQNIPNQVRNGSDFIKQVLNKDSNTVQSVLVYKSPLYWFKVILALEYTCIKKTGQFLVKLFTFSKQSRREAGGFASIVSFTAKQSSRGLLGVVDAIVLISISLGAFNMMPIMPLDGGRMVFELYQIVTRKRLHKSMEKYVIIIGIAIMLFLTLYVNILDIVRFVFKLL